MKYSFDVMSLRGAKRRGNPLDVLKPMGIATPVLQSAADLAIPMIAGGNHTAILCALARNDRGKNTIVKNTTKEKVEKSRKGSKIIM